MKKKDYIGKKLSECPDGTMAVVSASDLSARTIRVYRDGRAHIALGGGTLFFPKLQASPSEYTVHHIIKLGKPRPKTLADEGELEVWQEPDGWLRWRVSRDVMAANPTSGTVFQSDTDAPSFDIESDYTHLGKLEGLLIGGKVVKFGSADGKGGGGDE